MAEYKNKHPNVQRVDAHTDRSTRDAELDVFWSIDRLLPERPRQLPSGRQSSAPEAVEIEVGKPGGTCPSISLKGETTGETVTASPLTRTAEPARHGNDPDAPIPHYVPPHTADEALQGPAPCDEYTPDGVLLHRVRVFDWQSNYHYFDQFTKDAARYAAMTGTETRRESFFSYFPQYAQMNRRQTAWYLWWREQVRGGQYLDTDYAYVLLYLFELINLPVHTPEEAQKARDSMAHVWVAYRRTYPQIDHYMCEWLCDFCLIHHLGAPTDILAPALDDIISVCRLKEFYLSAAVSVSNGTADADKEADLATARILLRHCCQYDYRKSKFASGEHRALFDRIIPGAIAATFSLLTGGNGRKPVIDMQDSTVTRDAYTGALCAYSNKRRIEVSFTSFSRSHELRFLIGDMVKHTENRLRSWIGVRSRLSVMSLPIPLRDALDAYLAPLAPPKGSTVPRKEEPRPAYEALYDLPRKTVSLSHADAIEQSSWETTRILTEAFGGDEAVPDPVTELAEDASPALASAPEAEPVCTVPPAEPADENELSAALGRLSEFVRLALAADYDGERALAAAWRRMPDAVADEINAVTAECVIFDMILEDVGGGAYTVVEDYRDILRELLIGGDT